MAISLTGEEGVAMVTGIKVVAGVAMVTGITGMAAVVLVTAQVAMVTGGEITSPPSATDFVHVADLVVTAAAVVLAFLSPPEGSIVLWR